MKAHVILVAVGVLTLGGCAHVAETRATFIRQTETGSPPLVLKIERHMDTIVRGPDIEEDQTLVLELKRYKLGKRIAIPSDDVTVRFGVMRFGPRSHGEIYEGYVIIKSVTDEQIVARVKLNVTARTTDGSYVEQAKYHGDYTFFRGSSRED